jgi:hypothetical protein
MNFLRLLPVIISLLLLSAHFMRAGQTMLAALPVVLMAFLIVREKWVAWLIQLALVLGAIEWIRTLVAVAEVRLEYGMPWVRMAVILGAVAAFTALSSLVFRSKGLRKRYTHQDVEN